ncbi:MAG: GMC family oxidoreductase, partial [Flavobacteriaceae bacterium]
MNNQEFDYIVIGAGSAGCVAANRLSADRQNRVALVEAGASDREFPLSFKTSLPIGNVLLLPDKRYNWDYEFTTDEATDGRTIGCPRGKLFGGCSSVNGTVYMRGHRADYDAWEAEGNRGWGYKEVLEAFKKHENWHDGVNPDYHGTGGELDVAALREPNPISRGFIEAAKQAGHPETRDFNGPEQDGFGLFALNQRGGARLNSSKAFLHPVLGRKNLTVLAETLVEKIIIEGGRAVGLRVRRNGAAEELRVSKEIILSGGTINSPHLLMLSGIGPKDELERHGIKVVKDLAGVGGNLQDHVTVSISNEDPSGHSFALTAKSFPRLAGQAAKYLLR